jgi:hypothetical protein
MKRPDEMVHQEVQAVPKSTRALVKADISDWRHEVRKCVRERLFRRAKHYGF